MKLGWSRSGEVAFQIERTKEDAVTGAEAFAVAVDGGLALAPEAGIVATAETASRALGAAVADLDLFRNGGRGRSGRRRRRRTRRCSRGRRPLGTSRCRREALEDCCHRKRAVRSRMPRAKTLDEARKFLDPRPLVFKDEEPGRGDRAASSSEFYTPPPAQKKGNRNLPSPVENIRQRLLTGSYDTKMFLCGHVGSGKSTELNRLAVDSEILLEFSVVLLRFEEQEWATLDSSQVLFRIAGAIYARFKNRLERHDNAELSKGLKELNDRLFTAMGWRASEGSIGLELNLLAVKVKQELKLSEKSRKMFREFGETQQSLLQDVLGKLVNAVDEALAIDQEPPLLILADDMDKVRGVEQQREMFDENLAALMSPPVRIVYTLPTGVYFGENRADVRQNVEYLYPVRVLNKAAGSFEPEAAYTDERIGFFEMLVHQRVEEDLITSDAIRLAAIYSGGVLRDFFRLLREGIRLSLYNKLDVLDAELMRYAVDDARLRESAGLYAPDYDALAFVHKTNDLRTADDRRYLDTSRVLECYNGSVWFETTPLLWKLLKDRASHA